MYRSRLVGAVVAAVVVAAGLVLPSTAAQAVTVVRDGRTEATAAASCWEIKQLDPASTSGAYWLQTPTLQAPAQFYCDQEYDGGGWVLLGKGREGWQEFYHGQGDPTALLTRPRTPADFGTVQLDAKVVDGLLDGRKVKDLPDGVRLLSRNCTFCHVEPLASRALSTRTPSGRSLTLRPSSSPSTTFASSCTVPKSAGVRGRVSSAVGSPCPW